MDSEHPCPFQIGDTVRFSPSARTKSQYQDVEAPPFSLKIGEEVKITRISDGTYLYFEGDRGGWPWNEFEPVA